MPNPNLPLPPVWSFGNGVEDITHRIPSVGRDRLLDLQVLGRQDFDAHGNPTLEFDVFVNGENIAHTGEIFATDEKYQYACIAFVVKQKADAEVHIRARYVGKKMKFQDLVISGAERGDSAVQVVG